MLYGYPQPGKDKSRRLLEAFVVRGAGGLLVDDGRLRDPGDAAFYGVQGIEILLGMAKLRAGFVPAQASWYYLDNAFLDAARGTHYRIGRNALQGPLLAPDDKRLQALGVEVKPWSNAGRHILLAPQSDYFMREIAGWKAGDWTAHVMAELARHTDRPIRTRAWAPDKIKLGKSLAEDLDGCWALVTHSSAAAITALLAGVPVFLTGESPALTMGLSQLSRIEQPRRPDGRREWAARIAASQWTLEELAAGDAWRAFAGLEVAA